MFCFVFHFENMGNCILILTMLITTRPSYIISEFPKFSVKLNQFLGDIAKKNRFYWRKSLPDDHMEEPITKENTFHLTKPGKSNQLLLYLLYIVNRIITF